MQPEGLGDLLIAAARRLRRYSAAALEPLGIAPHHARALRIVVQDGPMRLGELAEALRVAPRSVTDVVDALESSGWAVREPDPGDRRAIVVRATTAGEQLAVKADLARRDRMKTYLERLPETDRQHLEKALRALVDQGD